MSNKTYNVAVVGASGAVGQTIVRVLEKRNFPINTLKLLSSSRSAGRVVEFAGKEIVLEEATPDSFANIDIALFSAGGAISKKLAPEAVKRGAVVIDNTSAYRMDEDVPLIVPEVNEIDIKKHKGIIANPNCSTIQMVAALKPIQEAFGLNRIIVSTYQAVSGAGSLASDELRTESMDYLTGKPIEPKILPVSGDKKHYQIAFNALPQIDLFQENGYTFEELKMINETKKIMHAPNLKVAATCVRIPVFTSHAESVYVEIDKAGVTVADFQEVIKNGNGITLQDQPKTQTYPSPLAAADKDEVFVGRIRKDLDCDNGFHLWIVADNLLKGAALNTVQIAESVIRNNWLTL
ncbi:aspartate-semialdehyde dehydrogenase [Virgibacillus soli]|uniref:aspartate-semialdehyde dehydrogenase n=1 Tax=Paracerasibacillus soli TaxID=480284 RepID=UPI0035F03231